MNNHSRGWNLHMEPGRKEMTEMGTTPQSSWAAGDGDKGAHDHLN